MTKDLTAVRFAPERTTLAVVLVAAMGALPLGLSSFWFAPLLLLPVLAAVWIFRARVVADARGLVVCNGLRVRRLSWPDVSGFEVRPRRPVQLLPNVGSPLRLTALSKRDLPRLLAVGAPS